MVFLRRRHLYHVLPLSPWPVLTGLMAFFNVTSFVFYMHMVNLGGYILILSIFGLSCCVFFWFSDIVDEATYLGYHTKVVKSGLKYGFMLFITSEVMLFFGFFWAFFHASLCPAIEIGSIFPPDGIFTIPTFQFPLFNTFVLLFQVFLLLGLIELFV